MACLANTMIILQIRRFGFEYVSKAFLVFLIVLKQY